MREDNGFGIFMIIVTFFVLLIMAGLIVDILIKPTQEDIEKYKTERQLQVDNCKKVGKAVTRPERISENDTIWILKECIMN